MHMFAASLLALLPLASAGPILHNRQGDCSASSISGFKWTVSDFDFHGSWVFTTPAHQNSWGYVNFGLVNPAVPYTVACNASSNQLTDFFYGTLDYDCTIPNDAPTGSGNTTFSFFRATNELMFNQTWECFDRTPYTETVWAYGAVNLTLDCTDNTYNNPNWTAGQIYSSSEVKCAPVTLDVAPYEQQAAA